jgi:hypothetical protein
MALIPPPSWTLNDATLLAAAGACLVGGAGLLLLGQKASRFFMAVIAGCAGFVAGWALAGKIEVPFWAAGGVLGATALVLGVVLSRLLWALLAGAICGAAAVIVLLCRAWTELDLAPTLTGAEAPAAYALGAWEWFYRAAIELWTNHRDTLVLAGGISAFVPLLAGLLLPRAVQILTTSLLGSLACLAGMVVATSKFKPAVWSTLWQYPYAAAGIAGGLMLLGACVQWRMAAADKGKSKGKPKAKDAQAKAPKEKDAK